MEQDVIASVQRVLQQWFSNMDDVKENDKKWFNCKTAVKHTLDTLRKHPKIIFKQDGDNKGTSKDFSRWLFSQLFRIVGEPKCAEIHGEILLVLKDIVTEYRCRSSALFCEVILELCQATVVTSSILHDQLTSSSQAGHLNQPNLVLFTGRTCLVQSRSSTSVSISSSSRCEAVLSASLDILNIHFQGLNPSVTLDLLGACAVVVEAAPPPLKSKAIRLAGSMIMVTKPEPSSAEVNDNLDLVLYLYNSKDNDYLEPEIVAEVGRFLSICLTGTEAWDPATPPKYLSWIKVCDVLDDSLLVLRSNAPTHRKLALLCVSQIYSSWNVVGFEMSQSSQNLSTLLGEAGVMGEGPRTPEILSTLIKQIPFIEETLILRCMLLLFQNDPRDFSIEEDILLLPLPFNSIEKIMLKNSTTSSKKRAVSEESCELIKLMVRQLKTLQLKVLDSLHDSIDGLKKQIKCLCLVWKCLVYVALTQPGKEQLIRNVLLDVVGTIESIHSDEVSSECLSLLLNSLLLYQDNKDTIPIRVKSVAKKLLNVNINSLSGSNKKKVLLCYVLLGSFYEDNLKYFIDPICTSKDTSPVFPLILLFSQMDSKKIEKCIRLLTNSESNEILTEVAKHADQMVLGYLGRPLKFRLPDPAADLTTTPLTYQDTREPHAPLPDTTVRNILSLLEPDNPVDCLLNILDDVTVLARYLGYERVVEVLHKLILHPDTGVRRKLAEEGWVTLEDTTFSLSQAKIGKLSDLQKKVLHNLKLSLETSEELKRTGLASAASLARSASFVFTKELLPAILWGVMEEDASLQHYVIKRLHVIAESQGMSSTAELFERYNVTICDIATKRILKQPEAIMTFLEEVSEAFLSSKHCSPVTYLLLRNLQHILPIVFHYGSLGVQHGDTARSVLKTLSDVVNQPVKSLVIKNFSCIFCYIARFSKRQESPFSFVEKVSGMSLSELMRCHVQPINNLLSLYLSRDRGAVVWGLNMLQANTGQVPVKGLNNATCNDGELAGLLEPRLLGILASLSTQQLGRFTEESYLVLESLTQLLQIFPPRTLTKWKNKLISILRNGLNSPDPLIKLDALKAWDKFVRVSERSCVGPLLGEIIAVLLPHIHTFPAQVVQTLRHLLLQEGWQELKEYVGDIGWLRIPDHPQLVDVKKTLDSLVGRDGTPEERFCASLRSHLEGVTSESCEVRAHSLGSLQALLHANQDTIHQMVLGSETVNQLIPRLIGILLGGVRDPDPDSRLLFCTCLGEVGAIDGGLLDTIISTETSRHKVFLDGIEDENFGPELLITLTKGYRNSSDQLTEDKFAFAIQEVLTAFTNCSVNIFEKFGERFDQGTKEIIEPHQNSKYILKSHNCPELVSPVFKSEVTSSFDGWLSTWTSLSLQLVVGGRNDKLSSLLITPLKIITSTKTDALQFLLPILVLQILIKGSNSAVDFVLAEMQAVLYATQNSTVKCDVTRMIAQTIFSLIDHITIWINKKRGALVRGDGASQQLLDKVQGTLNKVSKQVIAVSAYNCGAYNRALMYLEYKNKLSEQKDWELLQMIYVKMRVFEGVAGVTASRSTPASLKEQIQALETEGKLQETPPMYEQGIIDNPKDQFYLQGMLRNKIHTGLNTQLLGIVNDKIHNDVTMTSHLNEFRVQAAWTLARWDIMEDYLSSSPSSSSWAEGVGRQLLAARQLDKQTFQECIRAVRAEQLIPLSVAVMEGGCYERCYENVLNLHMLRDIEDWANRLLFEGSTDVMALNVEFGKRVGVLQDDWKTREPVYNLQRTLLSLVSDVQDIGAVVGPSWLNSAALARKEMLIPCCDSALQNASSYRPPKFKIERAMWLWDKHCKEEAMTLLDDYLSEIDTTSVTTSKRGRAEATLLHAKWREQTSYYDSAEIQQLFKKVTEVDSKWEEAQFQLANYYYKWSKAVSCSVKVTMLPHVIQHYGASLKYGSNNIFQSLPRLLTTWFELEAGDQGSSSTQITASQAAHKPNCVQRADAYISDLIKELPTFQWLTALSQILSRICHPSESVSSKLIEIASQLLYYYPQQTIWQIYSMTNNSTTDRSKKATEIIHRANSKYKKTPLGAHGGEWFKTFYRHFDKLCKGIVEISKKDSGSSSSLNMSRDFRQLKKTIDGPSFSGIILPIQQNTTVTLPVGSGPQRGHKAFPNNLVTIHSLMDDILVLSSLQRPKKITVLGSDGKKYGLLCKPKDDLRKDCRFMEFNNMVNRLLKKDPAARKKQLHIRTYAVVPLSGDCGIVEWVDNTKLLRMILQGLYAEYKMGMTKSETLSTSKKLAAIRQNTNQVAKNAEFVDLFKKSVLPRHPPVLSEWFRRTFPDPSCWFTARQRYTQTTAVISMVGYVVGLGDRHAENIMFDQMTGEIVHVDFDCLFEKGESFEWPERVPFRLTHNLVDAFGVTGVEGAFRLSCVETMRVMRHEKESLLSVLNSFVHDPLVEWAKANRRAYHNQVDRGRSDANTIMKDKAQEILNIIEKKLNGQMGKTAHAKLPISTEGQVNKLISDSSDLVNLSQMYIGWAPYY